MMPVINDYEKKLILKNTEFLFKKGFIIIDEDSYCLIYSNGKVNFSIFYERYEEASDISVKFIKENESFSVGWISRIMDKNKQVNYKQKMENIFYLLKFIEQNYNSVTNIHVCKRVMGEVEKLFRDDKF